MPIRRKITKKKATKKRAVRKVAKKRAVRKVVRRRAPSASVVEKRKLLADAHLQLSNAHRAIKRAYIAMYDLNDISPDETFPYEGEAVGYIDLVEFMGETDNLGYLIELMEQALLRA